MYETRDGAKSASLETEVFAQRYILIVVDATVGLATHHNDRLGIMFSACPPDCACVRAWRRQTFFDPVGVDFYSFKSVQNWRKRWLSDKQNLQHVSSCNGEAICELRALLKTSVCGTHFSSNPQQRQLRPDRELNPPLIVHMSVARLTR